MNTFPWLQDSINQWHKMISSQQVPHAILLSGIKGLGKFELAKQMAGFALCENLESADVCNQCSACELLKVGNHTDLSIITAEKSVIKVAQIRKLSQDIFLTASRGQYKVVIIENAEQMNQAAANALLKTLEEPPSKVIIILTTCEIGQLLPTIKSRCIKLKVNIATPQQAQTWLSENTQATVDERNLSLTLVNSAPLAAKVILDEDVLSQVKQMLADLQQLSEQKKTVLDISKQWMKNEWFYNLNYVSAYFVSKIKLQQNSAAEFNLEILSFIRSIYKFVQYLQTPLKVELMLEELLIHWKNIKEISKLSIY